MMKKIKINTDLITRIFIPKIIIIIILKKKPIIHQHNQLKSLHIKITQFNFTTMVIRMKYLDLLNIMSY